MKSVLICTYIASLIGLLILGVFDVITITQRNIRTVFVILAVVNVSSAFCYVYIVRRQLQQPLDDIVRWAGEIRQGNLRARLGVQSSSNIALVDDVNRASEWLEALADDMEGQLDLQRTNLESKSRSLQLLYDVARGINFATEVEHLIARLMNICAEAVGARGASARLKSQQSEFPVAELNLDVHLKQVEKFCVEHCEIFTSDVDVRMEGVLSAMQEQGLSIHPGLKPLELILVPLEYLSNINGVYILFIERGKISISDDVRELLVSIGRQLGMAIEKARLEAEVDIVPRMHERLNLANELHDSLAQTLASLKFQVRVLDETLRQEKEAVVWTELERIEAGITEANIEVRELITHFRAPVHSGGLIPAIQSALLRFRKESKIETYFQNEWDKVILHPDQEVNILRVVTESLANINKHSTASNVRVLLSHTDMKYRILVEDDGCGFDQSMVHDHLNQHYGLSIMGERASVIGGELHVESEPGDGTRVMLEFYPSQINRRLH